MTQDLFRQDAYLTECTATVTAITPQGIVLDRTVFYPLGGGQAGDAGVLVLADGSQIDIIDTRKGKADDGSFNGEIAHQPVPELLDTLLNQEQSSTVQLAVGVVVTARINWARRLRMMRFHTCSHLLCHIVPQLVNGCSITPDYARLDFNMTEALDKEALTAAIAQLVAAAHPVTVGAITDAELDANPALVKSMSVQPPRGSGQVRTIRIGTATVDAVQIGQSPPGADHAGTLIDLQPCGGTHVANTAEIGRIIVTKIEKKSAMTRRVVLGFAP
jgi:misacylated tRNA(Ala) deacylase